LCAAPASPEDACREKWHLEWIAGSTGHERGSRWREMVEMLRRTRSAGELRKVCCVVALLALPFLIATPAFAAVIFEDGFETGDFSKWNVLGGTPTVTSGDAHHGTYKAVLDASGENAQARFPLAPREEVFMRAYVKFTAFPAAGNETTVLGVYNYSTPV
jgi:hypothetical protein